MWLRKSDFHENVKPVEVKEGKMLTSSLPVFVFHFVVLFKINLNTLTLLILCKSINCDKLNLLFSLFVSSLFPHSLT